MDHWLARLAGRVRPRRGWPAFLVFLGVIWCLPACINWIAGQRSVAWFAGPLGPRAGALFLFTTVAGLAGVRVAHSRISRRAACLAAAFVGLAVTIVSIGHLLPGLRVVGSDLRRLLAGLGLSTPAVSDRPLLFSYTAQHVVAGVDELVTRLWWDLRIVGRGGSFWETLLYVFLAEWVAWLFGFFAAWQIYRQKSALSGLAASGGCLSVLVLYHPGAFPYLLAFLLGTLWLLASCNLWEHRDHWQATSTDYPDDLGLELGYSLAPLMMVLVVLAGLFPTGGFFRVSRSFWEQAERLFGPLEGGQSSSPSPTGTLPRIHLLGGSPELDESIVFYVTTNDPVPYSSEDDDLDVVPAGAQRYWRAETYDVYTGRGWASSSQEAVRSPPGRPIQQLSAGSDFWQHFQLAIGDSEALFAANSPYRLDQETQTWWRAPDDLVRITGKAKRYTVVSRVPEPTELELRSAPSSASLGISETYLSLPDAVPDRIYELAELVVAGAQTQFDKALALETFLRSYTYTVELPEPPAGRDLVDYFLFDLQQGYCDYYASAMVVMARAVGVPARLAFGYTQGVYDHASGRWVVTEGDAHSWVEVHFQGIGWVEFEPTAAQPSMARASDAGSQRPSVPPLPRRRTAWWHRISWVSIVFSLGSLLLIGSCWWLRRSVQDMRREPGRLIGDRFARLICWGTRMGQGFRDGQTASEYGQALVGELGSRGEATRSATARQAVRQAQSEVALLAEEYVRAQYGPTVPNREAARNIARLWRRLRLRLLRVWLGARSLRL